MPYFEFMMLIDDWIDEIEEEKKREKKRKEEAERERKKIETHRHGRCNPKTEDRRPETEKRELHFIAFSASSQSNTRISNLEGSFLPQSIER